MTQPPPLPTDQPPAAPPPVIDYRSPGARSSTTEARMAYNIITDTVTGPNLRWRDNLFQAACCAGGVVLGCGIGCLLATDIAMGLIAGGFIGLVAGLFGSGVALMIYRGVQHMRHKHD